MIFDSSFFLFFFLPFSKRISKCTTWNLSKSIQVWLQIKEEQLLSLLSTWETILLKPDPSWLARADMSSDYQLEEAQRERGGREIGTVLALAVKPVWDWERAVWHHLVPDTTASAELQLQFMCNLLQLIQFHFWCTNLSEIHSNFVFCWRFCTLNPKSFAVRKISHAQLLNAFVGILCQSKEKRFQATLMVVVLIT